jgi:hypothetical protein
MDIAWKYALHGVALFCPTLRDDIAAGCQVAAAHRELLLRAKKRGHTISAGFRLQGRQLVRER